MNNEQGMSKDGDIDKSNTSLFDILETEEQMNNEQGMLKDGDIDDSSTSLFNIPGNRRTDE